MNPIRRELLNGLFVLVVASLLSVAFAAFQLTFNIQLWVSILTGIAVAVGGYVMFDVALRAMASTEEREKEWLKRVGNPARLELGMRRGSASPAGTPSVVESIKAMRPGTDLTLMVYYGSEGGSGTAVPDEALEQIFSTIMEQMKSGTVREYKRLMCFDRDVLLNNRELKSGTLRVGEGPGTIHRKTGEHCRLMMENKGCSLYVAPVVLRHIVGYYGTEKVSISVETIDQDTGLRMLAGVMVFSDPPNGEIIEQFRQIERATERRMVAVHKVVFPEDAEPRAGLAIR
jgi:hypothetical protein